jgi:hypothetical protein
VRVSHINVEYDGRSLKFAASFKNRQFPLTPDGQRPTLDASLLPPAKRFTLQPCDSEEAAGVCADLLALWHERHAGSSPPKMNYTGYEDNGAEVVVRLLACDTLQALKAEVTRAVKAGDIDTLLPELKRTVNAKRPRGGNSGHAPAKRRARPALAPSPPAAAPAPSPAASVVPALSAFSMQAGVGDTIGQVLLCTYVRYFLGVVSQRWPAAAAAEHAAMMMSCMQSGNALVVRCVMETAMDSGVPSTPPASPAASASAARLPPGQIVA